MKTYVRRGKNYDRQCKLCGEESVSVLVVHVPWGVLCMVPLVIGELNNLLGEGGLKSSVHLIMLRRAGFVLGCSNWDRYKFTAY